ncbi:unnamed protein product [Ectocarpus sp. 13 AM-2016]
MPPIPAAPRAADCCGETAWCSPPAILPAGKGPPVPPFTSSSFTASAAVALAVSEASSSSFRPRFLRLLGEGLPAAAADVFGGGHNTGGEAAAAAAGATGASLGSPFAPAGKAAAAAAANAAALNIPGKLPNMEAMAAAEG